jgi:hypothetical protein
MTRTEALAHAQSIVAIINANAASIDLPEGYSVKTDISETSCDVTVFCSAVHEADSGLEPLSFYHSGLYDAILSGFDFDDATCENNNGQVFETVWKVIDFD